MVPYHDVFNLVLQCICPGMKMLYVRHQVSSSPADTIQQWFNAGGQLQYYDYDLGTYMNVRFRLL